MLSWRDSILALSHEHSKSSFYGWDFSLHYFHVTDFPWHYWHEKSFNLSLLQVKYASNYLPLEFSIFWAGYGFVVVQEVMSRAFSLYHYCWPLWAIALFVCEDGKCSRSKVTIWRANIYSFQRLMFCADKKVIIFFVEQFIQVNFQATTNTG